MANTLFDAPVAGQSLTAEVGARPWQQPAQYSTVEEAFEYYATKITDTKVNESLLDALEMGTPVSSISEILVQSGAMEGKHTIDVSILLLPVIMELIAYVADESGVDYNMGLTPTIDQDKISESKIALSVSKLKKKMPEIMVEETEPTMEDENMPEENSEPSGLMSRRM
jgi:hypothetical protein|tara:strand:+ start:538 stop:1044 length:507 start_codon:yes stop_codon:yes gene_type:complete